LFNKGVILKVDPSCNKESVTIQAPVVCDKHPDCLEQKGCLGLYKVGFHKGTAQVFSTTRKYH